MVQYEIKINGTVQGIGFRNFAQRQARTLNLCGWVKNTVDGGVVVVVQGEKEAVATLTDFLWIGPPHSQVKSVFKVEMPIFEAFSDFEMR